MLLTLDLRGNALTSLPAELARCTNLEILHLGGNKIAEFGAGLCEGLVNLREAYLYRNKLEALPPQVGRLLVCGWVGGWVGGSVGGCMVGWLGG